MNYRAPLYLASQSPSRRMLLNQAKIPFSVLNQSADEAACNWDDEPLKVVSSIARSKMEHVIMPPKGEECYVLTADTICVDMQGTIHGKPVDKEDAIKMLKRWREGSITMTGFCLDKKLFNGSWHTEERIEQVVSTSLDLVIEDEWIEEYLAHAPCMDCAGAMAIESYGSQFVKEIQGSYTNIIGLPLFEVRQALTTMGFFLF